MKKILLTLSVLLLAIAANAQQVSVEEAQSRAESFLQSFSSSKKGPSKVAAAVQPSISLAYTSTREKDQKVCFYVFNSSNNNGFVIVGGDATANEILAYSDNGAFDYNTAPENVKWWLSQYKEQISAAMDTESSTNAKARRAAKKVATITKSDVSPILSTQWNQVDPYNSAIPSLGSGYTGIYALATGCTATAMAQIMKHYNYPTSGVGSKSYTKTWADPIGKITFSADFANTTYDWANMTDTYSSSSTDAQKTAVATLMYHCAVALNTDFGQIKTGGSSASENYIAPALSNYFNYNKAVRLEHREYFSDKAWENMIYNELANGRPVLYGGQSTNGGHMFVCDGYKASGDAYHINWGWGGSYDGYFAITGTDALKPGGSGTGGAGDDASYTSQQEAVINIIAEAGGLESPNLVFYNNTITMYDGSNEVTSYDFTHGSSKMLQIKEGVANLSTSLTSFKLAVKATDVTSGYTYYWPMDNKDLNYNYATYYTYSFDINKLPYNGTYEIRLAGRNTNSTSDDDWYDVSIPTTVTIPTVTVTGASAQEKTDVVMSVSSNNVQVGRTLNIIHDDLYTGTITYKSSDEDVATIDENGVVTGNKAGTATITVVAAGNTYFNKTTKTFDIEVERIIKEDVEVTISATEIATSKTANISITAGYDGTPTYVSTYKGIATVDENGVVTGVATGQTKITVTIPATDYYNESKVIFTVNVNDPGLILYKEPYFSNDNNPWENDMTLHVPLMNASSETVTNPTVYAKVYLKEIIVSLDLGINGNFTKDATYELTSDLAGYQTYFSNQINTPYKVEFYKDKAYTEPFNIASINYTYRNTMSAYAIPGYSTLILPFNATIPDGLKVYSCDEVIGTTLELAEVSSIKRNTPYIVYNSTDENITLTGPDAIDSGNTIFTKGLLTGVLATTYVPQGSYVLQEQNGVRAFYRVAEAGSIKVTSPHAYLTVPDGGGVKAIGFDENDADAINEINTEVKSINSGIYNLNGQKLNTLQKGINIINGKKYFIK